jgi:NAD(P)-dependent dehydrogenase (short-subunit alcohol dehydrogenase family)
MPPAWSRQGRTDKVATSIREAGGRAFAVTGDLTEPGVATRIKQQCEAELGGIDILVNNAGGRTSGWEHMDWFGIKAEEWLEVYKLNVVASVQMIEQFVRQQTRGWGRVVQISSGIAIQQPPVFPDYQAAKAAEVNMTGSLSRKLAGSGVTANAISLGIIHTPGSDAELNKAAGALGMKNWQEDERKLALGFFRIAAGRVGRPEDVAAAVLYMCGTDSGFLTGAHLVLDGGGATPYMF